MALGAYPVVGLTDARRKRDELRGVLEEGRDPAIAKKLKVEAIMEAARRTFETVARAWHANAKSQWAPVHADDVIRTLERDVFPMMGDLPIAEINAPKALEVLRAVEARGAIETAKRLRQRISATFCYVIAEGWRTDDPPKSWAWSSSPCARAGSRRSPILPSSRR